MKNWSLTHVIKIDNFSSIFWVEYWVLKSGIRFFDTMLKIKKDTRHVRTARRSESWFRIRSAKKVRTVPWVFICMCVRTVCTSVCTVRTCDACAYARTYARAYAVIGRKTQVKFLLKLQLKLCEILTKFHENSREVSSGLLLFWNFLYVIFM